MAASACAVATTKPDRSPRSSRARARDSARVGHRDQPRLPAGHRRDTVVDRAAADDVTESNGHVLAADISGSVWKLLVDIGAMVAAGVEAMKTEFAAHTPVACRIASLRGRQGSLITAGERLAVTEAA